jgi:hypothetical protein
MDNLKYSKFSWIEGDIRFIKKGDEIMRGFIFRCNDKTIAEVFERSLFGDEVTYAPIVKSIEPTDKLFLYNLSTFEFSGPYEPVGSGSSHLVPAAWKSKFPAQIRFKTSPENKTIPFNKIEKIIKVYHKGMFPDMLLFEDQVKEILEILAAS